MRTTNTNPEWHAALIGELNGQYDVLRVRTLRLRHLHGLQGLPILLFLVLVIAWDSLNRGQYVFLNRSKRMIGSIEIQSDPSKRRREASDPTGTPHIEATDPCVRRPSTTSVIGLMHSWRVPKRVS